MPVIREYTPQYRAVGDASGRRASGEDFMSGSQDSSFLSGIDFKPIGDATQVIAKYLYERDEAKEVSDAHAKMAEAQADWAINYQKRVDNARPGDSITELLKADMEDYYAKMGEGFKYTKTQDYIKRQGAINTKTMLGHAVHFDSQLAVAKAVQDYDSAVDNMGREIVAAPIMFPQRMKEFEDSTANGTGMFSATPQAARNKIQAKWADQKSKLAEVGFMAEEQNARKQGGSILYSILPSSPVLQPVEGKFDLVAAPGSLSDKYELNLKGATQQEIDTIIKNLPKELQDKARGLVVQSTIQVQSPISLDTSKVAVDKMPPHVRSMWESMDGAQQLRAIQRAESDLKRDLSDVREAIGIKMNDDLAQAFESGKPVGQVVTKEQYIAAFGNSPATLEKHKTYMAQIDMAGQVQTFKSMSPVEIATMVEAQRPKGANVTAEGMKVHSLLKDAADRVIQMKMAKPIDFQQSQNPAEMPMLTDVKPNGNYHQLAQEISTRMPKIMASTRDTGKFDSVSTAELVMLKTAFDQSTPDSKANMISSLHRGLKKSPQHFEFLMNQLSPDRPALVVAGRIQVNGNEVTVGGVDHSSAGVSKQILIGSEYMRDLKSNPKADGMGTMDSQSLPKQADMWKLFADATKGLRTNVKGSKQVFDAVVAHYVGSHVINKNDKTGKLDETAFKNSIELVHGGKVVDIDGAKVLPPWGMNESVFKEAFKNGMDSKMIRTGMGYDIVEIADGQYMLSTGQSPVGIVNVHESLNKKSVPMFRSSVTTVPGREGMTQRIPTFFETVFGASIQTPSMPSMKDIQEATKDTMFSP